MSASQHKGSERDGVSQHIMTTREFCPEPALEDDGILLHG